MLEPRQDFANSDRSEVSVSHVIHTLRNYMPAIALGMAAVMVAYVIIATAAYLLTPAQYITTQTFRLDFKGADRGEYPNGIKFSPAELVAQPILLKVYDQNDLKRYVSFADFSRSMVVLESNRALESLTRDYQARLNDPKLTPIDRERIQREYEGKLASISKGQYALHYMRKNRGRDMPDVMARKVLNDTLREWSDFVANEQHVLEYRIAVLSPDVVAGTSIDGSNPVINADMLRAKVLRVRQNLEQIRTLPAAELARTKQDAMSLSDISIRLDEIIRFRLEPLVNRAAAARLDDRGETLRFLQSQLSYDERQLEAQQGTTESYRKALTLYLAGKTSPEGAALLPSAQPNGAPGTSPNPETVMPQLSDSFLERLIQLTSSSNDASYRQFLTDRYRDASLRLVPLQEAVAYHRSILETVRGGANGDTITRPEVDQQLLATRNEVRTLVMKMHEIYKDLSQNLNPSTELIALTGVPTTRVIRGVSVKQLAIYGVLTVFLAFPLLVFFSLLHNRVREEDEAEELAHPERVEQTA
ncbi:MAG: hypothetical protein ACJ74H_16600 [Thermoanaerobaculia bacterium]